MKPTDKAPPIKKFLDDMFERTGKIMTDTCVFCTEPDMNFRDELSRKEYRISGLCQKCQDKVFSPPEDDPRIER